MIKNNPSQVIGDTIPNNTPHAVSVTLPTWEATVGYEEAEDWVTSKMTSGYPRFYIHSIIQALCARIEHKYGRDGEKAMVFPNYTIAKRCREFIFSKSETKPAVRVLQLSAAGPKTEEEKSTLVATTIGVLFYPPALFPLAKSYWQHSGEGISSRLAEYVLKNLFNEAADEKNHSIKFDVPKEGASKAELQARKIQQISPSMNFARPKKNQSQNDESVQESETYIDQKYGRVLDLKFGDAAKVALRRRIIGNIEASLLDLEQIKSTGADKSRRDSSPNTKHLSEDDVYLYPSGMSAIFNAHQALLKSQEPKKSVCFGFPYVDTLNILRKFGPGVHFLGLGDDESLDEMEEQLNNKTIDIMALFCECPSNPLLKTPNLKRVRKLADKFDFAVVVDDTVGNFANIKVLPYADMVASSLTKIYSGDSDVMGGSLVLNSAAPKYHTLKKYFNEQFEDTFWVQDALVMERNSRDFIERSTKVNETSVAIVDFLTSCPLISKVYYPSVSDTKKYYDEVKTKDGGYGGLISFLFHEPSDAVSFFNAMNFHKGPSLGTNFTLACPYTILAHYQELDEVAKWDIDRNLIRISVGIEDKDEILEVMQQSLDMTLERYK